MSKPKKPKNRRGPVFALTSRMARRPSPIITVKVEDDDEHYDDDCPICSASRDGRTVSFDTPRQTQYLIAEARRALQQVKLEPGDEVSIIESGRMIPDRGYEIVSYTVDSTGRIFKTCNGARSLLMRIPID